MDQSSLNPPIGGDVGGALDGVGSTPSITAEPTEDGVGGKFDTGIIDTGQYGSYQAKGDYNVTKDGANVDGTVSGGVGGFQFAEIDVKASKDNDGNYSFDADNLRIMGKKVYGKENGLNVGALQHGNSGDVVFDLTEFDNKPDIARSVRADAESPIEESSGIEAHSDDSMEDDMEDDREFCLSIFR